MQKKKKDNPVAIGIMAVIFVIALFSVGRSLFAGDPQPVVRATAASASSSTEVVRVAGGPMPQSERDPFSSPLLKAATVGQSAVAAVVPASVSRVSPVLPAYRWTGPPPTLTPVGPNLPVQPSTPRPAPGAATGPVENETVVVQSIRVTAIVMGSRPYAVLEPAGGVPRTLHSAESYHTLRLVTIRPGEIVLRGRSGFWTLPLATAESESAPADSRN